MKRGRTGSSPSARRISPTSTLTLSGWTWVSGQTASSRMSLATTCPARSTSTASRSNALRVIATRTLFRSSVLRAQVELERCKILHFTDFNCDRTRPRGDRSAVRGRNLTRILPRLDVWRSYRSPTAIQPSFPRFFEKNGVSSAGALASPVRGGPMAPLQPPGTAVGSPHFPDACIPRTYPEHELRVS